MTAKHCAHCSVELAKAMRCSQCKTVCYCSRECQKQHWGSHKSQCKALALALLAPHPLPPQNHHLQRPP